MSTARTLVDAAEDYALRGWPVLPIAPGEKLPLTRHGLLDASTDVHAVRAWWTRWPEANIGLATGPDSFDVLDVDVRATGDGWGALARLRDAGLLRGAVGHSWTPSRGAHLFYPGTGQRNGSIRGQHVDFRSGGGYVLLPPSTVGQRRYVWSTEPQLGTGSSLDWSACVALLTPPRPRRAGKTAPLGAAGLLSWFSRRQEGERNAALYWTANRLIEQGSELDELEAIAVGLGLTEAEARRTIESARRRSA